MADIEPKEPTIAKVSEIELRAAEIKEKRALPTPPGKLVGFKDLQDWLALVPKDAEERITIWIYRREPIINRQLVDPQQDNNIDIIFNGFNKLTEAYMRENHGGGNYKFTIKDADKPKTQMGGYFEAVLDIPMIDCPPKLDLREVDWNNIKNKGFKSWCRARKMIGEDDKPMAEISKEDKTVTTGVDANMLKMMLDFTAKMSDKEQAALKQKIGGENAVSKSMNELFLEKMKQEDPNKQSQTMIAMITAIKGMQPEVKSDNTLALIMPMFMTMFQQMGEAANRQMTLLVEMLKSNKPEPKGEGSRLNELRNLLAIAKEMTARAAAPEKTLTESLVESLPSALQIVANIQQAGLAAKGVGGVTPPKSQGVSM